MARTRGCLWLTAGVIVAILAGIVAFVVLSRSSAGQAPEAGAPAQQGPNVQAVVATQDVPVGAQLSADLVEAREVPVTTLPANYLTSVDDALGKITLTNLVAGEVLLAQRLADPNLISGDGRVALVLSEGEVLMAFPIADLMSRINFLKPGDHVDLLFTLDFPTERDPGGEGGSQEEPITFNLLQNKVIAAIVGGQTTTGGTSADPQALLLTISPQEALVLKHVMDTGGVVDIVVRAPGDEGPVETEPVDVDYLLNRYQIPNAVGR
jgi:pilus assembly protein CpaB